VKIQYGIDRYVHESRRLLRTMEDHLAKSPSGFLVGDKCTIADIACWGWVVSAPFTGIDLKQYPHLDKWVHKCLAVPGFETGRHIPTPHTALEWANKTDEEHDAEAAKNSGWIQKGMQEDAAAK
jgi:glutathione S-transferase